MIKTIGMIYRILRRKFYIRFRKDYVRKMLKARKGVCERHGCCSLTFVHKIYNQNLKKCLDKKDLTKCLKWDNLPWECKVYPFDEKDKAPETRSYCNFHWKK